MAIGALAAAAATIAGIAGAAGAAASTASTTSATLDAAAPVPGGASSTVLAGSQLSGPSLGLAPEAHPPAQPTAVSPAAAAKPPAPKASARPAAAHAPASKAPVATAAAPKGAAAHPAPKTARTAAAVRPSHPAAHKPAGSPLAHVLKGVRHQAAAVQRPFTFYDSVTPQQIPAHQRVATYATGSFAVPAAQVSGRGPVLWIDTRGTDYQASVLDVEPGDATPSMAATWAWHKLRANPGSLACIYTMRSEWPATRAAISTLPAQMRSHIRWWIADPTGYRHIVPGANATQWYWGKSYDISSSNSSL